MAGSGGALDGARAAALARGDDGVRREGVGGVAQREGERPGVTPVRERLAQVRAAQREQGRERHLVSVVLRERNFARVGRDQPEYEVVATTRTYARRWPSLANAAGSISTLRKVTSNASCTTSCGSMPYRAA